MIATIVALGQRMLMKRPTVARTSETLICLIDRIPTRAWEPRTEITRPKDVTVMKPVVNCCADTFSVGTGKSVKRVAGVNTSTPARAVRGRYLALPGHFSIGS